MANLAILIYKANAEVMRGSKNFNSKGEVFLERMFQHITEEEHRGLEKWLSEERKKKVELMVASAFALGKASLAKKKND